MPIKEANQACHCLLLAASVQMPLSRACCFSSHPLHKVQCKFESKQAAMRSISNFKTHLLVDAALCGDCYTAGRASNTLLWLPLHIPCSVTENVPMMRVSEQNWQFCWYSQKFSSPKQQRVLPSLAKGSSPVSLCLVSPSSQASPNRIFSSVPPAKLQDQA